MQELCSTPQHHHKLVIKDSSINNDTQLKFHGSPSGQESVVLMLHLHI